MSATQSFQLAETHGSASPIPFPAPVPRLPYRVALPIILGLSVGFWALIWQAGTYAVAHITG